MDISQTQATLDDLTKYAASAPEYNAAAQKAIEDVAGGTDVGAGIQAGLKGAGAGLATGAGVGTAVAGAAVAVGALATGAVALQAIPIAGTIAGAVLGLVAGLIAFFSSKHRTTDPAKLAALQKEWQDLLTHIQAAIGVLPEPLRTKAIQLFKDTISAVPYTTPSEWAVGIDKAVHEYPAHLQAAVVTWAAEQAEIERAAAHQATKRKVGIGIGFLALLGLAGYAYKERRRL